MDGEIYRFPLNCRYKTGSLCGDFYFIGHDARGEEDVGGLVY